MRTLHVKQFFPFLHWMKHMDSSTVKDDLIAGITVALVLIPQSIAYAQLAGLPAEFGLYASLLPPVLAALFGSSKYLATGPVAVVSLVTASAIAQIPVADKAELFGYAILLALMVGIIQVVLGFLKLGVIVNLISHPVIVGFSNAAAIIIATSQLPKIFGVAVDAHERHYETLYEFVLSAMKEVHILSIGIALYAFFAILVLKKVNPKIPGVLIAVVVTTYFSFATGFERKAVIPIDRISSSQVISNINTYNDLVSKIDEKNREKSALIKENQEIKKEKVLSEEKLFENELIAQRVSFELDDAKKEATIIKQRLQKTQFITQEQNGDLSLTPIEENILSTATSKSIWHLKVGNDLIKTDALSIVSGGSIVGKVPQGLPSFALPKIDLSVIPQLFNSALIIALLGFMESISIAKSLASRSDGSVDPNQELIGQGLGNIGGAFTQGYPVAGSFSRTAVNFQSGAKTGLSSVFTSLFVLVTLLFFTPLLYHLPQSVLAVIIIVSVMGLVKFDKIVTAWKINKSDGTVALITFISTLFYAPDLDKGILIGIVLSTGYYIYTRARPRITILSSNKDGILHDVSLYNLKLCKHIIILRFDGSLFFANAAFLEGSITELVRRHPKLTTHVVLIANGVNYIDFTGIETLENIASTLSATKKHFIMTNIKSYIQEQLERSDIFKDNKLLTYRKDFEAIAAIYDEAHVHGEQDCPLKPYLEKIN